MKNCTFIKKNSIEGEVVRQGDTNCHKIYTKVKQFPRKTLRFSCDVLQSKTNFDVTVGSLRLKLP
jgi:hypothetical protein